MSDAAALLSDAHVSHAVRNARASIIALFSPCSLLCHVSAQAHVKPFSFSDARFEKSRTRVV